MSVAIEVKTPNGGWFQLVDGVKESGELVEEWVDLARELYPASEVRVVEAPQLSVSTRH
ncbi:hypothetical protein AB6Q56_01970 [Dechloromonas sp. ARDL1]|uniref:hypothetical protein n=1 Tax=Dechloromonas sp. ARDL1 TaxID=3322121 RepID=UPI003DA71C94